MYNIRVLIFILFLLTLPCVCIIYAHTDLENAKTDYAIAASEYAIAYGKWETAERIKGDLENSLEVTVSEWNSNLEDIGENIIDALGWKMVDVTNAIKQGAKTVGDLFDRRTLAEVKAEKQAKIDNIAITIPQLVSDRDEKERVYKTAKARYQSLQHLCSGCNNLIDELGEEGHRSLLCGNNHTYYECNRQDKWLHTATFNCAGCRTSPLQCDFLSHAPSSCGMCRATYYACSWGSCYFGPHPQTGVYTCLYPSCHGGYNLSGSEEPYAPHHHTCTLCSGSSCSACDTSNFVGGNNNQGTVQGNGGNTNTNRCQREGCNELITATNAETHQQVTCDTSTGCGVQYWNCDSTAVTAHEWVSCARPTCPLTGGTGVSGLFSIRRCRGNPSSCLGGGPHTLRAIP